MLSVLMYTTGHIYYTFDVYSSLLSCGVFVAPIRHSCGLYLVLLCFHLIYFFICFSIKIKV